MRMIGSRVRTRPIAIQASDGWRRRAERSDRNCHQSTASLGASRFVLRARSGFTFSSTIAIKSGQRARHSSSVMLAEIDDVAMMSVGRAVVDLLAADVGEDHFGVAGILVDQPTHLGERRGNAFLVGVVEGETHAEDDAALEALAGVAVEPRRVVVAAGVEQDRR